MLTEQDIKSINIQIGEKIKFYRKKIHGITQNELAELANVKRTTITNIECGNQKLSIEMLYHLCDILGLNAKKILPKK